MKLGFLGTGGAGAETVCRIGGGSGWGGACDICGVGKLGAFVKNKSGRSLELDLRAGKDGERCPEPGVRTEGMWGWGIAVGGA